MKPIGGPGGISGWPQISTLIIFVRYVTYWSELSDTLELSNSSLELCRIVDTSVNFGYSTVHTSIIWHKKWPKFPLKFWQFEFIFATLKFIVYPKQETLVERHTCVEYQTRPVFPSITPNTKKIVIVSRHIFDNLLVHSNEKDRRCVIV